MTGTLFFHDEKSLAKFLTAFAGSSATFKVVPSDGGYVLTFTGGY